MVIPDKKTYEIANRLQHSRMRILKKHSFYAILLFHLKFALDDTCETSYTNGIRIAFNPDFLDKLSDDELDFTVEFKDTDGVECKGEFLDIVLYRKNEYVIIEPENGDGYVDIFRLMHVNGKEVYVRMTDDEVLDGVFEVFRMKNEDEFDFE